MTDAARLVQEAQRIANEVIALYLKRRYVYSKTTAIVYDADVAAPILSALQQAQAPYGELEAEQMRHAETRSSLDGCIKRVAELAAKLKAAAPRDHAESSRDPLCEVTASGLTRGQLHRGVAMLDEQRQRECPHRNIGANPQGVLCRDCRKQWTGEEAERIWRDTKEVEGERGEQAAAPNADRSEPIAQADGNRLEPMRRDLARLLDNLFGLHFRPGHLDAVMDVIHLHAPTKQALPPPPARAE